MTTRIPLLRALLLALLTAVLLAPAAAVAVPPEDYASYQPQRKCSPSAKPGTAALGRWLVTKYGGGYGSISRSCGASTSEHQEGRAFDWSLNAASRDGRQTAKAFLERAFAEDRAGNPHALARRMGIMYVIWNDTMYAAWNRFEPEPYLSSSCKARRKCSKTLRHRDHVHISLTRPAGKGRTSWYARLGLR